MTKKSTDYHEIENYWVEKKKYCLTFFKRAAMNGKKAVIKKYGQEKGLEILDKVKGEYERLLPEVPYVGEIDIMQRQMLLSVIFASFYFVLKEEEKIGDIWVLCNNFNKETLMSLPGFVRKILKNSTFSKKMINTFKELDGEHKEKNLADQWDFVEGDGKEFDYGMNMRKCAKLIFFENIGIEEFAHYMCLIDKNFAESAEYGFIRTQVLAEGADYCDFRLKKNGPVDVRTTVKF